MYRLFTHSSLVLNCHVGVHHLGTSLMSPCLFDGEFFFSQGKYGSERYIQQMRGLGAWHCFDKAIMFNEAYTVIKMVENNNGIGIEATDLSDLTPVAYEFYRMLRSTVKPDSSS